MAEDEASPSTSEVSKRLAEESRLMREAISHAVINWASLENSMAFLMAAFFEDASLGMALYYTPNSTDARISLLNTCFHNFCEINENFGLFRECWKALEKRVSRLKNTRNRIVHGNVLTHCGPDRVNHIRLTYPIFDHSPANRDRRSDQENHRKMLAGDHRYQKPGMSSSDVLQSANAYAILSALCNRLRVALFHLRKNDSEEWKKAIVELASDLLPQAKRG